MSTKDYVYLALLAFSAIVFYLHGWYAGAIDRNRRREQRAESKTTADISVFVTRVEEMSTHHGRLTARSEARHRTIETPVHCFFGNN